MKTILLCLHGWGGSQESFTELREALKGADLEILTPDLPGFGDEPDPPRPWSTDDYADWVVHWFRSNTRRNEVTRVFVLGHSHGGRIALKLASRLTIRPSDPSSLRSSGQAIPIDHVFLCAPAGIRHARHFKRIIGLTLAKAGKFLLSIPGLKVLQPLGKKLLYTLIRVHDYEKASPVMRETMMKVSAEDLTPLLSSIPLPTDIFWGADDRMTPVSDGRLMAKEIPNAKLHLFNGIRHRVHRERAKEIADRIRGIMAN